MSTVLLAMEWGFRAHERGWNLEKSRAEFLKVLQGHFPPGQPYWRRLPEDMQETVAILKIEDIRDGAKYYAHEELDGYRPRDLAGFFYEEAFNEELWITQWVNKYFPDYKE